MNKKEVLIELGKINSYLNKCLWMDFEFCMIDGSRVAMVGKISQSYNQSDIEILFEYPHFVSSPFMWTSDPSKPFINLCAADKEAEMNTKYRVELGSYVFEINAEDYDIPTIIVIAKKISCVILNEKPVG